MYKINEIVIVFTHGPAVIKRIEDKLVGAKLKKFYILNILNNQMTYLIPVENSDLHIRPLIDKKQASLTRKTINDSSEVTIDDSTWNRRYSEYYEMIKSGIFTDWVKVYKSLKKIKEMKDLSFGERKILDSVSDLIYSEIHLVLDK